MQVCAAAADCGACETCAGGACQTTCSAGQSCARNLAAPGSLCCDSDKVLDGKCCTSISQDGSGNATCCYSTSLCCPAGQTLDFWSTQCVDCNTPAPITVYGDTPRCRYCPNRVLLGHSCVLECPDNSTLVGERCYCHSDAPLTGSGDGICYTCDNAPPQVGNHAPLNQTGYQHCDSCNFRGGGGGYCFRCAAGTVGWSQDAQLKFRDGRILTNTAGTVYTLPSGATVTGDGYGHCIACGEVDIAALAYQRPCVSCGGTWNGSGCTPP